MNDKIITIAIIYIWAINVIAFITYDIDKKKAINKEWRIPEATLLGLALLGGSVGAILAMYIFHHKTRKKIFKIGIPVIMVLQVALIIFMWYMLR